MKYDVIEYRGYDGKLTLAVVPRIFTVTVDGRVHTLQKPKKPTPKAYNPFKGEYE